MRINRFLHKPSRYSLALMLIALIAFPLVLLQNVSAANPPQPTYGSANMNGDPSEWDLNVGGDFFAYMYRAGNPSKQVESNVSLRYDCCNQIMYVLVMTVPGVPAIVSPTDAWGAIDSISNKVYTGNSGNGSSLPAFVWIGRGYDGNNNHAQGYQAAFSLAPGNYTIIIHIQVEHDGSQTSATTGFPQNGVPLVIICNPAPAIEVTKMISTDNATWIDANTPPGPIVTAGSNIYYKFNVTNTGNVTLSNITLTDSLYSLTATPPTKLPPNASYLYFLGPLTAEIGQHTNTANATGTFCNTKYSDTDDANYNGAQVTSPAITVIKFVSADNATWVDANTPPGLQLPVGGNVYYKYVVINVGNVVLSNLSLTDNLYSLSVIPPASLAVNQSFTYYYGPVTALIGQHTNTATATGQYENQNYTDTDNANYFGCDPSIAVTKLISTDNATWVDANTPPGLSVLAGSNVYYQYIINNTGNVELTHLSLTDSLYVISAVLPSSLNVGETISYFFGPVTALVGQHSNIATASGRCISGIYYNATDPANYFGAIPSIQLVKWISTDNATWHNQNLPPGITVANGSNVYFKFEITNTGNVELTNITLTDDTYTLIGLMLPSTLAPDQVFNYYLGPIIAQPYQHTNNATATGAYNNETYSDFHYSNYFGTAPSINVHKYISSDNSTWIDANDPPGLNVTVGSNVYYLFIVNNTGNVELYNITLTDSLYDLGATPPFFLAPDEFYMFYYGPVTAELGQHTNTATDTGQYYNETFIHTDDANYYGQPEPVASINVTKQVSADNSTWIDDTLNVTVGDNVYFRYILNNTGNVELTNLTLTDNIYTLSPILPSSLLPNETYTYYFGPITALLGLNSNTATATGIYNGTIYNGTDTAAYNGSPVPQPSITIIKQVSADNSTWIDADTPPGLSILEGARLYFRYIINNTGNTNLTNITLTDNVYSLSASPPSTLMPNETYTYYYGPVTAQAGQHTNTANVTALYNETTYSSVNDANYYGTQARPSIIIVKQISTNNCTWYDADLPPGISVTTGSNLYYRFIITNNGNVELSDITLTDNTYDLSEATLPSTLAPNASYVYYYGPVTALEGQHTNLARTTGTYNETIYYCTDNANYKATTKPCPSITVTKLISTDNATWVDADCAPGLNVTEGSPIYYMFIINNTGNVPLTNITLKDSAYTLTGLTLPSSLDPNATFTYYLGPVTAQKGQHSDTATATGKYNGKTYSGTDKAYYYGNPAPKPSICITKYVSADNCKWSDANSAPGLKVSAGSSVYFKYVIKNTGNVVLNNITFSDAHSPSQIIAVELAPGKVITIYLGPFTVEPLQNMNNATVTAKYNNITCQAGDVAYYYGSFCTYTSNEYSGTGTAGKLLNSYFCAVFPTGLQIGNYNTGIGYGYKWTSTSSLKAFLKCTGTSGTINCDKLNPTNLKSGGGTLAVQVVALTINVGFSNMSVKGMPAGFGELIYVNNADSLSNQTVNQILAIANGVLGGQPLPDGYTYNSLKTLIQNLNAAFDCGKPSTWALTYLKTGTIL